MDTSAGLTSAGAESVPTEALPQGSSEFQAAQSNLGPEAEGMTANQVANANVLPSTPNAPGLSSTDLLGKGLTSGNLGSYAMDHLGQVAAVGVPLLSGATSLFKQPTVPTATNTSTNPFGMKTIPRNPDGTPNFQASIPAVPSPHYQATYPNYVQNPYQPTMAASGGLMDIPKYSGADYGSMVTGANEMQQGLAQATSPQQLSELQKELIAAGQESSKNGVYNLSDIEYAKMTPAALMKAHKIAVAKGLQPVGQLGDYEITPAAQAAAEAQAKQSIASEQAPQEAKEGGVIGMAIGGSYSASAGSSPTSTPNTFASRIANLPSYGNNLPGMIASLNAPAPITPINNFAQQGSMQGHIYQPSYANYGQPSQGIPMPTRGSGIPAQGYAMDPLKMQGSPAYNANQATQQAQLQQIMAAGGMASGGLSGYANGGMSNLGGYSDGGHLLKGPGDGVSDSIPATIGGKQPARLAEGEFVIPARIVSELGNGSTDAGAKRLYAMMDRIKAKRSKTKNIAADTKAYKYLPA